MPGHKFAIGDRVQLVASAFSVANPNDIYTVCMQLPFQDGRFHYRLQRADNGEQRAVSEDQLVPAFFQRRPGIEEMKLRQRNWQRTRNADARIRARRASKPAETR